MSVGDFVLFYRDENFNPDDLAESGVIVADQGLTKVVRSWTTEDNYAEYEIPNKQIKTARTVWRIRGSPLVMDHRPIVVGVFFLGFMWEWLISN